LIAAVVIVVLAIAAGIVWKAGVFTSSHTIPNLVGLSTKSASATVASDGYTLDIVDVSSSKPASQIVSQSPLSGATAKSGAVITVNVSTGPSVEALPRTLVGETCPQAEAKLAPLHVTATCPAGQRIYSNVTPANRVARVLYKNAVNPLAVPRGASVILERSKGPHTATTTTTSPATTTTSPTTTTTTAATGPRAVPNVVGDDYAQTVAAMLYFTTTGHDAGTTKWTKVISESPGAGTMVGYKSTVTLTVQ
jgi:beta-lactam-binding protein with PASTA domain